MTAEPRCGWSDLLERDCAHCREIVRGYPYDNVERVLVSVVIEAQYPGECGLCGRYYQPGTSIGRNSEHGWVCMRECGEET